MKSAEILQIPCQCAWKVVLNVDSGVMLAVSGPNNTTCLWHTVIPKSAWHFPPYVQHTFAFAEVSFSSLHIIKIAPLIITHKPDFTSNMVNKLFFVMRCYLQAKTIELTYS